MKENELGEPVFTSSRNLNEGSDKEHSNLLRFILFPLLFMLVVLDVISFTLDFSRQDYIELVLSNLAVVFISLFVWKGPDWGIRPLKVYRSGLKVPQACLLWKPFPGMGKPVDIFLPFDQIEGIQTRFSENGTALGQRVYSKESWENNKKLYWFFLDIPTVKELMNPLEEIVGREQLLNWFKRLHPVDKERFCSSPEVANNIQQSLKELVGEEMTERILAECGLSTS